VLGNNPAMLIPTCDPVILIDFQPPFAFATLYWTRIIVAFANGPNVKLWVTDEPVEVVDPEQVGESP